MNVCENVLTGCQLFPDKPAIEFEGRSYSYLELERSSAHAAHYLHEIGVEQGDRVGIVLPNVPAFIIWYFAALRLGAVAVSVSTRLAPSEVAFILNDCDAKALVATESNAEDLASEAPDCIVEVTRLCV